VLSGGVLDGRIVFDAGEIVAATNHDQSGQSAFATLLTLKRGSFRFEAGPPEVERTIHQPTSSLLLDALREQDESGRTSHAGAPGSADDDAAFDFEHRREAAPDGWLYAGVEQTPDAGPEETASARGPEVPSLLGQDPFGLSLAPAIEAGPSLEPPHAVASSPSPIEPQLFQAPEPRPSRSAEPRPAGVTETDPLPELPAQPIVLSLPLGGGRTFLLRGRSGRKGRLPRRLAIGVAAASILLASGYALFSPALRRSDGVVEGADYRRLVLEAAANQAKIDSLEQVVQGLTNSVRTGDVSQSDAARQISRLQTEIHQASADLDVARRAADAKLDTDRRGEGTGGDAPAASPGGERAAEVSRSPAASRIVQTLADSNSSVLRADLDAEPAAAADDGSPATEAARPAAEVSSLDVVPVDVAIPAASAPADVPASSPAAGADYSLTALRNGPTFVPVDTRPTPRASLHPQYPPALAARNIGGTVTLWTLVDGSGRVEDVRVLRSSGQPELDKAATDAIRLAAFKPARRNGVAVPAWTQQQVAFRLD
jgi:protein TonB